MKNNRLNKRALYESIMSKVARVVNESLGEGESKTIEIEVPGFGACIIRHMILK